MTNSNYLKSKMVLVGDEDYVNTLAELLHKTRQTVSSRLNGESNFTQTEIRLIADRYKLTANDINIIFIGVDQRDC